MKYPLSDSPFQPRFQWLVVALIILVSITSASAQYRFRTKGRINTYLGGGGGYLHENSTSIYIFNQKNAWYSTSLVLGGDYGITKRLAGGITIFRNGFSFPRETGNETQKAENGGIGLYALFYLDRRPKHTWYTNIGFGYSGLFLEDTRGSSYGKYYQIGLGVRRYFGPHFGFFVQLRRSVHYYKGLSYESGYKADYWKMNLTNLDISAGLVVAFGKK